VVACGEQGILREKRDGRPGQQLQLFLYVVLTSGEVATERGGLLQRDVSAVATAMGVPGNQSTVSNYLRRAAGRKRVARAPVHPLAKQLQQFLYLVLEFGEVAERGGLRQRDVSAVATAMGVPGSQVTVSNYLRRAAGG